MNHNQKGIMALAAVLIMLAVAGFMVVPGDSEAAETPSITDVTYGVVGEDSAIIVTFSDNLPVGSYTISVFKDGAPVKSGNNPITNTTTSYMLLDCNLSDGYYTVKVNKTSGTIFVVSSDIIVGTADIGIQCDGSDVTKLSIPKDSSKDLELVKTPSNMMGTTSWRIVSGSEYIDLTADGKVTGTDKGVAVVEASFECARQTFTATLLVNVDGAVVPSYKVSYEYGIKVRNGSSEVASGTYVPAGTTLTISVSPLTGHDRTVMAVTGDPEVETEVSGDYLLTSDVSFRIEQTSKTYSIVYQPGAHGLFSEKSLIGKYGLPTPAFPGEVLGESGYVFVGWSPEVSETVKGAAIYVAQWEAKQYDVSVTVNVGSFNGPAGTVAGQDYTGTFASVVGYSLPSSVSITIDGILVASGYTYDSNTGVLSIPSTLIIGNVTINAEYSQNDYTITYMVDGAEVEVQTYNYGDAVVPYVYEPATGMSVSEWSPALPETMPAEDLVVTAETSAIDYTITYMVDGAEVEVQTYNYGDAVVPYVPVKTGYRFVGWTPEVPAIMPAENLEFTAVFEPTTTKAFIERNDNGSVTTSIIGIDGSVASGSVQVSYIYGYMDGEYYRTGSVTMALQSVINEESSDLLTVDTPVSSDDKIQSIWSVFTAADGSIVIETPHILYEPHYIVSFDSVGGSDVDIQILSYGSTVTEPLAPTKEGFTFSGWFIAADGGEQWDFQTEIHRTLTLYAHWSDAQ